MRRLIVAMCLVGTTAAGMPASASPDCGPATAFENEQVRIWFQGFKGHVKVENRSGGTSYDFKTTRVAERDGDVAVADLNLERAYPVDTGMCTVEEDGEVVTITYGVTGDVRREGGVAGQATVTFVYHFNTTDAGAKFDLIVDDWPWTTEPTQLAFGFHVKAEGAAIEPAENGVGFRDADGNPRGHLSWDPEFTARYADEHEEPGTVDSATTVEDDTASVVLGFQGVTPGYNNLTYDPWMSVGPYIVAGPLLIGDRALGLVNLPL